jgi:drug/metabolite transporter (DMT)-like permease
MSGGGDATRRFGAVDALLLLVVLFWAVNYSVVKVSIAHIPPLFFNSLRLVGATVLLLSLARVVGRRSGAGRWTAADLRRVFFLGLIGHTAYQICFILGIYGTTATQSALLLGTTPVAVAIVGALSGAERPSPRAWAGTLVSLAGVALIVGRPAGGNASWQGEVLTVAATFCWAVYTVGSGDLLLRYGPLRVTAYTMTVGTAFFLPLGVVSAIRQPPATAPASAWLGLGYSFVFALAVSYYLWYYGVRVLGPTRTAIYSNLTPPAALAMAALFFGEPPTVMQLLGAAVIFLGVYLVRKSPERSASGPAELKAEALSGPDGRG